MIVTNVHPKDFFGEKNWADTAIRRRVYVFVVENSLFVDEQLGRPFQIEPDIVFRTPVKAAGGRGEAREEEKDPEPGVPPLVPAQGADEEEDGESSQESWETMDGSQESQGSDSQEA